MVVIFDYGDAMEELCGWDSGWRRIASGAVWLVVCLAIIGCALFLAACVILFAG